MKQTELNKILEQHKLWIDGKGGKCANLTYADLRGANLRGASLNCANLVNADLEGAELTHANLTRADLRSADIRSANLTGANITGADLQCANLTNAILPDISWIIQDSFGVFIQDNREEKTFDMLAGDRIIRNIPDWVKYSGLKQVLS